VKLLLALFYRGSKPPNYAILPSNMMENDGKDEVQPKLIK